MKRAWLVVNAFLDGASFRGMSRAFLDAADVRGIKLEVKTNADFIKADSLRDMPRAVLFFDKDIRLARRMEDAGARLFNSAGAIAVCDDKTLTALALDSAGLPQPETILCPMSYPGIGFGDAGFLRDVAERLGFPMVVKEGKGSFGQQVYLAHDMDQLKEMIQGKAGTELLFQRFVIEAAGSDLRLYVVGDEPIAAIRRVNTRGDFRANLENGGEAAPYSPTREETALAIAACKACGADFAGLDLLQSRDGPLVCEVNSNAHFLGLMGATGVNPALAIMDLVKGAL